MKNPYQSRMRSRQPAGQAITYDGTFGTTAAVDTVVPNFFGDRGLSFQQTAPGPLDLSSISRAPAPGTSPLPPPAPTGLAAVPPWAWILGAAVLVGGVYMVTKR